MDVKGRSRLLPENPKNGNIALFIPAEEQFYL